MGFSAVFLGDLDMLFLASYAVGLYISGSISDRVNAKKVLVWGSLLSVAATALFGIAGLPSINIRSEAFYATVWCINGLAQSSGWPSNIKIMGNWFGGSHRGAVFGIWSACVSIGNILGGFIGFAFLQSGSNI